MKNSKKKLQKKGKKKIETKKKIEKKLKPRSKVRVKPTAKVKSKTKVKVKVAAKTRVKVKSKTKVKVKVAAKTRVKAKSKAKVRAEAKLVAKTKIKKRAKINKPVLVSDKSLRSAKKTTSKKPSAAGAILGPVDVQPYYLKKNESYMSKKHTAHFQEILLLWKERLMTDVDSTMHHMQDDISNYPDPVDRASQEEEFSLELRTRDRERKLLKKIEETLMRISEDDYGYCDDCGAEIGIRRLEARPTATQCIECKTIAELREKQIGESN